jgi:tetratricopeptide (TPR) repeat protein
VNHSMALQQVESALAAANWENADVLAKVEMLVEIATGLQVRPRAADDLYGALRLYERALQLCPADAELLSARVTAKRATALQALPGATLQHLEQAMLDFEQALQVLEGHGTAEEIAELEMNLGLAKHTLAPTGKSRLNDSVAHYHRALRTFTRERYPAEYATLHNNLATAYLAMPSSDQSGKLREALAVQSFEAALQIVTLEDYPNEYAMLQNNLGNALQNSASGHALSNRLRAVEAYTEALKVRDAANQPGAYANTIANLALCLSNLPDDNQQPELGNPANLARARGLYQQAIEIFQLAGETDKVAALDAALQELPADMAAAAS